MMKQLLLAGLLGLAATGARAQAWHNPLPVDSTTHRITYAGVVEVPGVSKAELYSRAREWFATSFGSSKAVLEMDDREVGKLVGRANEPFSWSANTITSVPCRLWRTIKVEVKDGRYRYALSDFDMTIGSDGEASAKPIERHFIQNWANFTKDGNPRKPVVSLIESTDASGSTEVASLRTAMAKPGASKDW